MPTAKTNAATGSMIDKDRRAGYKVTKTVKTPSGRPSIDTDDGVAKELRGKTVDELRKIAKEKGGADLVERFDAWVANLNAGQVRMNLGNVLRGIKRNGGVMKKAKAATKPKAQTAKVAKPKKAKTAKPKAEKKPRKAKAKAVEPPPPAEEAQQEQVQEQVA